LVVHISNPGPHTVLSVIYGGLPLIHLESREGSTAGTLETWALVQAPVGTADIVVTMSGPTSLIMEAESAAYVVGFTAEQPYATAGSGGMMPLMFRRRRRKGGK